MISQEFEAEARFRRKIAYFALKFSFTFGLDDWFIWMLGFRASSSLIGPKHETSVTKKRTSELFLYRSDSSEICPKLEMSISEILKAAGIILISSVSQMTGIIESTANGKPAIVNIYSEFCGYSHQMAGVYANYVPITANKNIDFYGADANEVEGISTDQGISGVPTFIGFACGKEITRVTGADKEGLSKLLTKLGNIKC